MRIEGYDHKQFNKCSVTRSDRRFVLRVLGNVPNGSVQLSGTSNSLDNADVKVFIEVKTPDGVTDELTASADKQTARSCRSAWRS